MQNLTGQTFAGGGNRGSLPAGNVNWKMGMPSTQEPPAGYSPNRKVQNSGMTHMSVPAMQYPYQPWGHSTPAPSDANNTQLPTGGAGGPTDQNMYSVYPEQYTRAAQNWLQAQSVPAYNDLYRQWTQPGIAGTSPYQQWGMGAQAAQSVNQGAQAAGQLGVEHMFSNLQQTLAQQMLSDQLARMWGQAGYQDMALQQAIQQQQQATLADYLLSLAGAWL